MDLLNLGNGEADQSVPNSEGEGNAESDTDPPKNADDKTSKESEGFGEDIDGGLKEMIAHAPETIRQLQEHWEKNPMEFYFLIYSLITTIAMFTLLMYRNRTAVMVGFGIYTVTAIPILYTFDDTNYFSPSGNRYLDEDGNLDLSGERDEQTDEPE